MVARHDGILPPRSSIQVPDPHDAKCAHDTIVFRYRHVLTRDKMVTIELEAWLIIFTALGVVIKRPCPPSTMHKSANFILPSWPKSLDATSLTSLAPLVGNKLAVFIERRGKFIASILATVRELMITSKFEPNALHRHGRGSSSSQLRNLTFAAQPDCTRCSVLKQSTATRPATGQSSDISALTSTFNYASTHLKG